VRVEVLSYEVTDVMACFAGITASGAATLYVTTGYGS
jgi:hypothetical protein